VKDRRQKAGKRPPLAEVSLSYWRKKQ